MGEVHHHMGLLGCLLHVVPEGYTQGGRAYEDAQVLAHILVALPLKGAHELGTFGLKAEGGNALPHSAHCSSHCNVYHRRTSLKKLSLLLSFWPP